MKGNKLPCMQNATTGRTSYSLAEEQMGQSDPIPIRTSQKLADEYGVAERTIRREGNFSKVVDILPEETKHNVLSGKENITRSDKLVVWNDTLIDGHNRYRIATEHGLTYETVQKEFESREHALNWIISNQLGRRNLNPNQIAYLRGKRYETEKVISTFKGNQYVNSGGTQLGNHQKQPKTGEILAKEYNVGKSTISRNSMFSQVVDILPEKAKQDVLGGNEAISHSDTSYILKFDKPTQKKFIKEVESGTPIKEAVKNTWL